MHSVSSLPPQLPPLAFVCPFFKFPCCNSHHPEHNACSSPLTTPVVPHEVPHSPGPIHQPCSFPSSASMTFQPCSHSLLPPSCLSNTPPAYGAVSVPGHDTFTPQIHHRKAAASTEHAVEDADQLFIRKLQTELWETQQSGFTHGGISESLSF